LGYFETSLNYAAVPYTVAKYLTLFLFEKRIIPDLFLCTSISVALVRTSGADFKGRYISDGLLWKASATLRNTWR
jgi:hypothetical protein